MPVEGQAQRVTVYVGSSDTWQGTNLALAIVDRCRKMGIAGATACLGVMGFGKQSRLHRAHLMGLSEDLPERIEIVDRPDRIAALLPILDEMVDGGLIIVEDVQAIRYRHHGEAPAR
jgi:PII-like signaling protein